MWKRFAQGFVALTAVLASLLLAEGFLWLFAPQQLISLDGPQIWRPDDDLGWRVKSNLDTFVNTGEGSVHLVTDARGMRIGTQDPRSQGQPDAFRILAAGDSFVEALGVDYEATLSRRLELDVSRLGGKPAAVSAIAASGWNPHQYLLAARRELQTRRYDLGLIFLYAANDIVGNTSAITNTQIGRTSEFRIPRAWTRDAWTRSLLHPVNDFLEQRSHLFVLLKTRGASSLARLGLTSAYFPQVFRKTFAASPDWNATVAVCREIRWEFDRHDTPVVFVLLPAGYQVHQDIFESYVDAFAIERNAVDLEQPNRILGCVFAKASMTLLDPLNVMRAKVLHCGSLFGQIDRHLNAAGNAVVSRYVAQALAAAGKQSSRQAAPATLEPERDP